MAFVVRRCFSSGERRILSSILQCRVSKNSCFATAAAASTSTAAAAAANPEPLKAYRTTLEPDSFTTKNIGQWYTVPVAHLEKLSYATTLPSRYSKQVETVLECSLMVRLPLVDLINCLRRTNPDFPACRYVLYGWDGTGKSIALWQTAHWAHSRDWIVCYLSYGADWTRRRTEIAPSAWKTDRFDQPLLAAEWLVRFKTMNEELINRYKLETTKDYTWTARENTPVGSSLTSIVDLGIARPKLASDCFGALLRELKIHAKQKRTKVLIAVDMVNAFFFRTQHRRPDGNYMKAWELSLVHNMRKMCSNDWNNGAVVTTVDHQADGKDAEQIHLPYYLLGQEGFEMFDPFVPIEMTAYNDHEANSCLDYYIEKNWLQRPAAKTEQGRRELIRISAGNPNLLERTVAAY